MYVMFNEQGIDLSGYFVEWTTLYTVIPALLLLFGFLKSLAMVREFYTKDISLAYNLSKDPEYLWKPLSEIEWCQQWRVAFGKNKGGERAELFAIFVLLTFGSFMNAFIMIFRIVFSYPTTLLKNIALLGAEKGSKK